MKFIQRSSRFTYDSKISNYENWASMIDMIDTVAVDDLGPLLPE